MFKIVEKDKLSVFLTISLVLILFWFVQLIVDVVSIYPHDIHSNGVFHQNYYDYFADFNNINVFLFEKSPYFAPTNSSYPPMNFIIAYPFYLIRRAFGVQSQAGVITSVVLYFALCSLILAVVIKMAYQKFKLSKTKFVLLVVVLLLSSGTLFAIERANYLILTFLFVFLFLLMYNSNNRAQREIALLLLAVAIACKLYPVMFAILLLKQKRFKDLFKTALYSLIMLTLPFALIGREVGFLPNVKAFIKNLATFSSTTRLSVDVSLSNFFNITAHIFKFNIGGFGNKLILAFKFLMLILVTIAALKSKRNWVCLTLLALPAFIVTHPCSPYALLLLAPAIFSFFASEENSKFNWVYLLIFVLILTPLQFGHIIDFCRAQNYSPELVNANPNYLGLTVNCYMQSILLIALAIILVFDEFIFNFKRKKAV